MTLTAIFVGLPGAGKSTVGRIVANRLHQPFIDSDRLIVQKAGMSISDIFSSYGERFFRELEHEVIAEACANRRGILSLGGGALLDPRTRALLIGERVIFIDVEDSVLVRRLRRSRTVRPALGKNIAQSVAQLRRKRIGFYYEVASDVVVSDDRGINMVVGRALDKISSPLSTVPVMADPGYNVVIGHDVVQKIVRAAHPASKVLLVHSPNVTSFVSRIDELLSVSGLSTHAFEVPDGEAAKSLSVVELLWNVAGDLHLGRDCVVVAVGGGATTDVAGFFASTWMRGVRLISVPTTLLGMVDAAVGGKTAINTNSGKNLVGTFWTPSHVFCDIEVLSALPEAEVASGLAEVAKCGFIADSEIISALDSSPLDFHELIRRAVAVKARIVGEDLRESGVRELLNYGHTLGHAIEKVENFSWKHGAAVSVGCVFAAALSVAAGFAQSRFIEEHQRVLASLGLPVTYSAAKREEVERAMLADKKVRAGVLRFVVVDESQTMRVVNPSPQMLDFAWEQISL